MHHHTTAQGHRHEASGLSEQRLRVGGAVTLAFVLIEVLVGRTAHSLAVLSDAGHNFADAVALVLAARAAQMARRPAAAHKTYGYHRISILAALLNGSALLVLAAFIVQEAIHMLARPPHLVAWGAMLAVAVAAVVVNGAIAVSLRESASHTLNVRAAFAHTVSDALSAVGVILAAAIIGATRWVYADPIVSMLIAGFIGYSAWHIVSETVRVLLEDAPRGLDPADIAAAMQAVQGVEGVHDLHVWTIADHMNAMSCHLDIRESDAPRAGQIVREVKELLVERYAIDHSTIETECPGCVSDALFCRL